MATPGMEPKVAILRERRPPLGRASIGGSAGADHEHPEMMQRQGKVGDFMAALETRMFGEARTRAAQGEAGVMGHEASQEAPGAPVGGAEAARAQRVASMAFARSAPAERAPQPKVAPSQQPETEETETETPEEPLPEREGGPIPMQSDVWKSQAEAAEFERRLETLQSEQQITQLRDQADHHREQAELLGRQGTSAEEQAGLAQESRWQRERMAEHLGGRAQGALDMAYERAGIETYIAGEQAEVLREEGKATAAEARRSAEIAGMNADEKRAHFEAFNAQAQAQMADLEIEGLERQAQMRVVGASRGAGGSVIAQQGRSEAMKTLRKVGQIGHQVDVRRKLRDIGIDIEETRAAGFEAKAKHAESVSEIQAVMKEESASRRAELIKAEGRYQRRDIQLQAERQQIAAKLDANSEQNLRIQSAQLFLKQDAQQKAEQYADSAADITDWALDNRPPIPDYVAIGKEQDRANALRNLGTGLGIIGQAFDLGRKIFGLF